jgi:hypothetical protein
LYPFVLLLLDYHLFTTNIPVFKQKIYNYPVNDRYEALHTGLYWFPAGSTIGFSNESFYWLYLYNKEGHNASRCLSGNEDYLIKQEEEQFPQKGVGKYELYQKVEDYEIYKRNK